MLMPNPEDALGEGFEVYIFIFSMYIFYIMLIQK